MRLQRFNGVTDFKAALLVYLNYTNNSEQCHTCITAPCSNPALSIYQYLNNITVKFTDGEISVTSPYKEQEL